MPYNVQLPNGVTIRDIPDDVSQEEARKRILEQFPELQQKPKIKDYLKDIPKAVGRGAAGMLETSAIGASALLPEEYEKSARKGIESLAAPTKEYLAPSSQEVGESISSQIASGVGSTAPFFVLGPMGAAGRIGAGALGVSAGAGEARQAAEAEGATPEERSKATLLGAPTGLLDIIAPEIKPFKSVLTTAAARGGVEGLTEAAQKVAQNMIAKGVYNPNQEIMIGAGEEGAYGAGVGALTSLIVDLTLGRRAHVDLGGKPKELGQTPVAIQPQEPEGLATLPSFGGGFDAERAAALRAEAAQDEQDRLAGIEAERAAQQPPLMLGYSPLPGTLIGTPSGQVALNPEQEFAERYRPQPTEEKKLELAQLSAQEQEAQDVKDALAQQQAIRKAELEQRFGKQRKSTAGPFSVEEKEAMGIPVEERKAPQYKATEHPENKGFVLDENGNPQLTDLAQGGQKFKNKAQAEEAKGNLADYKAITMPGGGWALSPKTDAELAREGASKLGMASVGTKGMPLAAHELIASEGGLDSDAAKNANLSQQRVGNRYLVAGKGKGVTANRVRELLESNGYVQPGEIDDNQALQMVADSVKKPVYTPDGYEHIASVEREQQAAEAERADLAGQLQAPVAEEMGYPSYQVTHEEVNDALARLADAGFDADAIAEQAFEETKNGTDEDFGRRVVELSNQALGVGGRRGEVGEAPIMETLQAGKKGESTPVNKAGAKMEKELTGKSFDEAVDWMIDKAPNKFQKMVGHRIKDMAAALRREGVKFNFAVHGGNYRNAKLYDAQGVTSFIWNNEKKGGTTVYLFLNGEPFSSKQLGYPSGMDYSTLQHEMLHVVTRSATRFLPRNHPVIVELNQLFNTVVKQYNRDRLTGKLPDVLQKYNKRINNVLATPDEMITWGLTDRDFQNYLDNIKVGPKQTVFSKLVQLVRELMGIEKNFETALERLVRTTESILDTSIEEVKAGMTKENVAFGEYKPPTTKLRQESLFSKRVQQMLRDDLMVRKNGFYFDAKTSPLYQKRTEAEAKPVDDKVAMDAIMSTKVGQKIMSRNNVIKDGDYVGVRLDLNILRETGVPVQSIHQGKASLLEKGAGFYSGEVLKYAGHATIRNVHFKIQQTRRENIAAGVEQKSKMGSADGQWVDAKPNYDGIELHFNPRREHLFRDALGRAVKYADEITTTGVKVFARGNIEYYGEEDVPARAGTFPSEARLMQPGEAEGGVRIDQPGNKVSIPQQESLFMRNEAIRDDLAKRADGFYIKAEESPLYQRRSVQDVAHPSMQQAEQAVASTVKGRRIEEKGVQLQEGQYVGTRLDLSILSSTGVPVQAIHEGKASTHEHGAGFYGGDVLKYAPYITMRNVRFKINQPYREKIASGIKKKPMGSADGQFVRIDNPNFDGVELRFNPKREHLFVDAMGRAVKYAEEITSTGNSVFARGYIEYYGEEDFVHPAGTSLTRAVPMDVKSSVRETGNVATGIQESLFSKNGFPSVEQIAAGEEEQYLTRDEKVQLYLSKYPNANRRDMIVFDDAIFFKQPNGQYTDDPLGREDRIDMRFENQMEVARALRDDFGLKISDMLFPINKFNDYKKAAKPVANEPIMETLQKGKAPQRTQLGNDAMEMLAGIGRTVAEPETGYAQKVRESWDNYRDNPKATREAAYGSFRRFADQIETWAFSSDAALNNQIRREIMNSMVGNEQKIGMLLNTSLSQTAHSDAVSNLFLMEGNIKYDEQLHKWVGVKDENNIINLSKKLDEIAEKAGLTKAEVELLAHTAFEARRTRELIEFNENVEQQVGVLRAQAKEERAAGRPVAAHALSEKASNLLKKKKVVTNMTPEALQTGLKLYQMYPGLKEVTKIWNGIRQNALDRMVETGLYTEAEAEMLMDAADYVPFYREEQIEAGKGPKEFLRSLAVQADKKLKGSAKPVNDIFDNMVRWTQYAINRGVRNRSGVALAKTAVDNGLAHRVVETVNEETASEIGEKDLSKLISRDQAENVIRVWENGKQVEYSMADPMFVSAFRGLESVAIPTVKVFSKFADILRQSVVLYPLFSIAQVPQDSFAAMFTSGLKPQHALTIPVRAVKEFIQTLRGKSKAHEDLKNVGAVGVRDFTSAIIRADAEIAAGLKEETGIWNRVKRSLGSLAMAADNAVRQATYEAALAQGLTKAEAIEKAFEIFNVRRRGNSQMLALAGQVIPFFNAYLAAQHVAYRTLTGVGTSPTQREAALKTLGATTGAVMALSVIYAMMNGDDDDYLSKPTPTRDRLLMIPGTGGFGIPLRADLFVLPKALAEHTYLLLSDNGYEDPAKFRASMASILANSIFSPTPVPQAIKPLAESIMNYDFFQQKPLVGTFQQQKELSRQFEDSTSEFAKLLGSTNMVSPIIADHFMRGMFGSFGGLFLYATNPVLASMSGTPRPELSIQDAMATIPNASGFVSKEYEVALRKDFYALKEATDRVAATMSDLKTRSPQEIADYLSDEDVRKRLALAPAVNQIAMQLTNIRKTVTAISQAPEERMDEAEKQRQIKQLREAEEKLLKGVNLKRLREMANL